MKNFTQKFIVLLALVFSMVFSINAQEIGDLYEGGYIFQINEDGTGLVADLQDLGLMNWDDAMDTADVYTSQGYDDWYLPSKEELELIYNTIGTSSDDNIGGFDYSWYWSSSEYSSNYAWFISFGNGGYDSYDKTNAFNVRVIRSVTFDTEVSGCTDSSANNYNVEATIDDESCTYAQETDCLISEELLSITNSSCAINDGFASFSELECNSNTQFHQDLIDGCLEDGNGSDCVNAKRYSDINSIVPEETPYQVINCLMNGDSEICQEAYSLYPTQFIAALSSNSQSAYCLEGDGWACLDEFYNNNQYILSQGYSIHEINGCFHMGSSYNCEQALEMYPDEMEALVSNVSYSSNTSYLWQNSEGLLLSNQYYVSNLSPGMYSFTFSNSCCSYSQNFEVGHYCEGCTDETAINYYENATTEDGTCIAVVNGCTDESAFNYSADANTDDGSCNSFTLHNGWSMFGYTCLESQNVVEVFSEISESIVIVKDEWGLSYMPSWEFNAMGSLQFSEGYQINMIEEVTDFQFCEVITPADVDAAYEEGAASVDITSDNQAAFDEGAASVTPEDGIGQAEVDAAYADGVASVDITSDNQAVFDEGAASVTPEDGITQVDLDAVHAMYEGWCESDLDNDGICDVEEVSGCMDTSSCNYVSAAEFDDGSCDYESCLDECGVINGDNSSCTDECGVPNGDNSSCTDCAGVLNGTSEDLGCGCGNPAAEQGYDCDGNINVQVGDEAFGGIVFQINENGTGLVSDLQNLGSGDGRMTWYNAMDAAASATSQGYYDWYLPSLQELQLMYSTIGQGGSLGNIGGFNNAYYWSSDDNGWNIAQGVHFYDGYTSNYASMNDLRMVRVIRAF